MGESADGCDSVAPVPGAPAEVTAAPVRAGAYRRRAAESDSVAFVEATEIDEFYIAPGASGSDKVGAEALDGEQETLGCRRQSDPGAARQQVAEAVVHLH